VQERAAGNSVANAPPYFPTSLVKLVEREDPVACPHDKLDASNPFLNKKVLILSGADDKLVPWEASREFVERLEVGPHGLKKYTLHEGVGHECTREMLEELGDFVTAEYLKK
jgi:predicted esterase